MNKDTKLLEEAYEKVLEEKKKKENPNGHLNAKFVRNRERKIENSANHK